MKKMLAISGSANSGGSNNQLLELIAHEFSSGYQITVYSELAELPLFAPAKLKEGEPMQVNQLKDQVADSEAVIICTPEYLHNIPAALKNAFEWMTESGELAQKPILAMTFTPHPPRGEYAMQSLCNSLVASKSNVVAELPLYQNEMRNDQGQIQLTEEMKPLIEEALRLL